MVARVKGLKATFFWRFYGPHLRLGQLKRKKELNKANIPATLAEKLQARSINDLLHGRHKDNFFLLDQRGKSPAGQMVLQLDRFPYNGSNRCESAPA